MSPYRDPSPPAIDDGPVFRWRSLVCRVAGHDRFHLLDANDPWICLRCGARDRQGLSVKEFLDAVREARNWYGARGSTLGVETMAFTGDGPWPGSGR